MINLKPLSEQFKNVDEVTKNQLKELALVEALKEAVSENELKQLKEKLEETYAKAMQANRKADINYLELSEMRKNYNLRLSELEKPKNSLEIKVEQPKVESVSWREWLIKKLEK